MISIVNYGIGNIGSVANMLKHIGVPSCFAASVEEIDAASMLVLPGVGAFGMAMQALYRLDFVDVLRRKVMVEKTPILGICLGMQLLGNGSEESNSTSSEAGLGFIDADFVKFRFPAGSRLKVPHMGWSPVSVKRETPLLAMGEQEQRFYFVHSYYARCNDPADVIATAKYGDEFTCIYGRDNVFGTQFHPEKSHRFGMKLLKNFATYAC
jgi:glutamine amidotransferase